MALTPEVLTSAGLGAAVVAILAALAGKFLAPQFLKDRLDHERETDAELVKLRERIDAMRIHLESELNTGFARWHDRMDKVNVLIGGISIQTDRNEKDIASLAGIVRGAESAAARIEGTIAGLTIAVQALTAATKRNGAG